MSDCELLETCGFFKKYKSSLEMACRGFLKTYCHGDQMNECKRKEFRKENGHPPHDDMLPSGQMIPDAHKL
jgi:hypothetical protein